jgi:hypothetical protein
MQSQSTYNGVCESSVRFDGRLAVKDRELQMSLITNRTCE